MSHTPTLSVIFRHEYGKLVATLSHKLGIQRLELIEDAVQFSMLQAIEHWPLSCPPDNPAGWLYTVAYRFYLSHIEAETRQAQIITQHIAPKVSDDANDDLPPLKSEMIDDLLRLLFMTCIETIPVESQLAFTLKAVCGFSIEEISARLFISEANTYKRFTRAKNTLKQSLNTFEQLQIVELSERLPAVQNVLYLLFTEGYLSAHHQVAIRRELCEEAIRLTTLLTKSPWGDQPSSRALLALMHLHLARIEGRQPALGALLLLEQQDRSLWDSQHIAIDMHYLSKSAEGNQLSRYHLEASIAAEHCLASSFEQTRWDKIAEAYARLEIIAPSPLHRLARAVAIAEWQGAEAALELLSQFSAPPWLLGHYHWYAVLADLHFRAGEFETANNYAQNAYQHAPVDAIQTLLRERFKRYPS